MNGEGFACFRWHCLEWPAGEDLAHCIGGTRGWCIDIWRDMQRRKS